MKFPSYEKQNEWLMKYVAPIMIDLDFGTVIQNFKDSRRDSLRKKMQEVGVFDSLKRLEEGTSWDKIMKEIYAKEIHQEEVEKYIAKEIERYEFLFSHKPCSDYPERIRELNPRESLGIRGSLLSVYDYPAEKKLKEEVEKVKWQ